MPLMLNRVGKAPITLNGPKNSTSRLVDLSEKLKETSMSGTTLSSRSRRVFGAVEGDRENYHQFLISCLPFWIGVGNTSRARPGN
jgi:hypothetical protein